VWLYNQLDHQVGKKSGLLGMDGVARLAIWKFVAVGANWRAGIKNALKWEMVWK
jgi:hypothetical protein